RIKRLLPKAPGWLISALTVLAVGGVAIGAVVVAIEGGAQIVAELPQVLARLQSLGASITVPGTSMTLAQAASTFDVAPMIASTAAGLQDGASGIALTFLYLAFLLVSGRMITKRLRIILASRSSNRLGAVLERSIAGIEAYVSIQTLTGLMIAIASGLVMYFAGLSNAPFWAIMIFMFAYLPVVGVFVGSIGPTLFALLQFPTLTPAIIIFVSIQVISFIVGNLILPKLQADTQNIDPSAGVLAIGIWTALWGIPGAFMAIPLTLSVMYTCAQYERLRWIAVLMSNDGSPMPDRIKMKPDG
ncbi:MAG: AI-2E family transporter, partial [Burkholderiales bacterium]